MYASKVSFSNQTRALINARPMSVRDKGKLRRQRVLDFIRETPNGEARAADLIEAAGFNAKDERQYQRGWAIIALMLKHGTIVKSEGSNTRNHHVKQWTIPGDVKTVVKNDSGEMTYPEGDGLVGLTEKQPQPDPHHEEIAKMLEHSSVVEAFMPPNPNSDIKQKAQEFAWVMNSDSLRQFVAWLER